MANRYCGNCGSEISEANKFCPSCGKPATQVAHIDTSDSDVNVPPVPTHADYQTQYSSYAPARARSIWKRPLFLIPVGCFGLLVIFFFLAIIGVALSGGGGTDIAGSSNAGSSNAGSSRQGQNEERQTEAQDSAAEEPDAAPASDSYNLGDDVTVGDMTYTVTNAETITELPDPFGIDGPLTGNFVLVTFNVANGGSEPATVSDVGMYLYDSQGSQYETDTDAAFYLPDDKSLFLLDRINPGLSREVQTIYSVPPEASGFELEVTSGFFATESARITLGF